MTAVSLPALTSVSGVGGAALIGHGFFVNGPVESRENLAEPVDALN